jgi:8-oxo-dGTP diphosphatase
MPDRPLTLVAVGILQRADGTVLFAQRPSGKDYAGYWEFPGGKIEPGESDHDALVRELQEELGVRVTQATAWLTQRHVYPHAFVELRFFRVTHWLGEVHPQEGQAVAWQSPAPIRQPDAAGAADGRGRCFRPAGRAPGGGNAGTALAAAANDRCSSVTPRPASLRQLDRGSPVTRYPVRPRTQVIGLAAFGTKRPELCRWRPFDRPAAARTAHDSGFMGCYRL